MARLTPVLASVMGMAVVRTSRQESRAVASEMVCDKCGSAACAAGDYMCYDARRAAFCTRAEWEAKKLPPR